MKCPLCGAPECPNNEDWNDCDQNLLHAGAELLAAAESVTAIEFFVDDTYCLRTEAFEALNSLRAAVKKARGK
jgi:hypothetical protein